MTKNSQTDFLIRTNATTLFDKLGKNIDDNYTTLLTASAFDGSDDEDQ
jgi:hypothetical protein